MLDALADVEALLSYTPAYRPSRYSTGMTTDARTACGFAVRVLGRLDEEILEFRWGPN